MDLLRALARRRLGLGVLDDTVSAGDLGDNLAHDLVLDQKDIGHLAIELVGPNVGAGLGVDELRRDAEIVASAPDAALEYIAHPKLAPEQTQGRRFKSLMTMAALVLACSRKRTLATAAFGSSRAYAVPTSALGQKLT